MKTPKMFKTIVYFDQLSKEAKERARKWWKDGNDYPFLEESIKEYTTHKLEKAGYDVSDLKVYYSLSYCQGDGVSFTANLTKGIERYEVNQRGNYTHEMTMSVYHEDEDGNETEEPAILEEMRKIARMVEKMGYSYIDEENEDEIVDENITCNEYTFSLSGERMDADV